MYHISLGYLRIRNCNHDNNARGGQDPFLAFFLLSTLVPELYTHSISI